MAYFSPFPPQKSGISNYSELLLPFLSHYSNIDIWVSIPKPDIDLIDKYPFYYYVNNRSLLKKLDEYDIILYNIGNNPEFHSEIYNTMLQYPGYLILHDYVIFFLVVGYYLNYRNNREELIKEFYLNYGIEGISAIKKILRSTLPPLQYPHPEKYPLLRGVIKNALGIIVHSESTRQKIIDLGYEPSRIVKINHLIEYEIQISHSNDQLNEIKRHYGLKEDDIVIASFGYIAPTKRNEQVIRVMKEILPNNSLKIKYIMVGEGNYVDGLLDESTIKTGFVSKEIFKLLLEISDIIVNLRYPSMGECSGTLIQAMTAGKPCIVSDDAWFSELPDDSVLKIPIDSRREYSELKKAIISLVNDKQLRMQLGQKAQNYVVRYHNPEKIAENMWEFLNISNDIKKNNPM